MPRQKERRVILRITPNILFEFLAVTSHDLFLHSLATKLTLGPNKPKPMSIRECELVSFVNASLSHST